MNDIDEALRYVLDVGLWSAAVLSILFRIYIGGEHVSPWLDRRERKGKELRRIKGFEEIINWFLNLQWKIECLASRQNLYIS